ncbi:MAG: hypothetical protein LUD39_01335 [Opitutae bacterium]|nr:hypothetical protein [Opitutae bacterium]
MGIKYSVLLTSIAMFLGVAALPVCAEDEVKPDESVSAESLENLEKAAKAGEAESQVCLALIYGKKENPQYDVDKAFYWLHKAAEQDNVKSLLVLGERYLVVDVKKSISYLERAANLGSPRANFLLGYIYLYGVGEIEKDLPKALSYLKTAADLDDVDGIATYGYALLYAPATSGVATLQNQITGEKYIYEGATRGNLDAQVDLGALYLIGGRWVKKDREKALEVWAKAARNGSLDAKQRFIRNFWKDSRIFPTSERDIENLGTPYATKEEVLNWFNDVIENRRRATEVVILDYYARHNQYVASTTASGFLAVFYRYGISVEKDVSKSEEYLEKALDGGSAHAILLAVSEYEANTSYPSEKIIDVAERQLLRKLCTDEAKFHDYPAELLARIYIARMQRNLNRPDTAADIFTLTSRLGDSNPSKLALLGICYEKGYGIAADKEKAREYYMQGVEKNNSLSMRYLGDSYFAAGDIESALKWYNKAVEYGDYPSKIIDERFPNFLKQNSQE